jgi:gluconokinase
MGVAGCGKSSLAEAVCSRLGWTLIEGDDFHGPQNKAKMHAGIPLTDDDRLGWLDALGDELRRHAGGTVLSCSALKHKYRDTLRAATPGLRFVYLDIDPAQALERVKARAGDHFFPPDLVKSQFEALEPPTGEPGVLRVDASRPLSELCAAVVDWLGARHILPS